MKVQNFQTNRYKEDSYIYKRINSFKIYLDLNIPSGLGNFNMYGNLLSKKMQGNEETNFLSVYITFENKKSSEVEVLENTMKLPPG